jgi:hypothetical protein
VKKRRVFGGDARDALPGVRELKQHDARVDLPRGVPDETIFGALPDGKIEGALLSFGSHVHWLFALASAVFFVALLFGDVDRGRATRREIVRVLLFTATVGTLLLFGIQLAASATRGSSVRGYGWGALVFYIVKSIGFSYDCARDPANDFFLSFFVIECVLPEVALRQWVLTFPFSWRRRLAQDGALFAALTRIFVATVERFYATRARECPAKSGAVVAAQRTSSDMRLNPLRQKALGEGRIAARGHGAKASQPSSILAPKPARSRHGSRPGATTRGPPDRRRPTTRGERDGTKPASLRSCVTTTTRWA